jgi:hypothetical protein
MATTTYFDFTAAARAINARTDAAGAGVTDLTAEEDRLSHEFVTAGWIGVALSYAPTAGGSGTMTLFIGSDGARTDYYTVPGSATGQGKYVARLAAKTGVTIDDASPTLARKDEVYLVIEDHAYDGNSRSLGRLGYRTGTPAVSPVAPGADSGWNAYALLATIDVPAGAPDIEATTITDERQQSQLIIDAATLDGNAASAFSTAGHAHGGDYAPIAHDGDIVGHPVATTGASGFLDNTDHAKLDAVAAGAEVNPTATEIRDSIKTVDGAGSGLDADLLDSIDGSGLATAGHAHGATHYTKTETNVQVTAKRNKAEFTEVSNSGDFAGTFGSSTLSTVPATNLVRDDWGGGPTIPALPGAGTMEVYPDAAGMYLIFGQIAFDHVNTTGTRQAQIETTSGGTIAVRRKRALASGTTIVQVAAVYQATSDTDRIKLRLFHTAGAPLTIGVDSWLKIVALEH